MQNQLLYWKWEVREIWEILKVGLDQVSSWTLHPLLNLLWDLMTGCGFGHWGVQRRQGQKEVAHVNQQGCTAHTGTSIQHPGCEIQVRLGRFGCLNYCKNSSKIYLKTWQLLEKSHRQNETILLQVSRAGDAGAVTRSVSLDLPKNS